MKKTILTAAVATAVASGAMAQGIVTVGMNASHPIQFTTTGSAPFTSVPTGTQVSTFGTLNIVVMVSTSATSLSLDANNLPNFAQGGWVQGATVLHTVAPLAGDVAGNNETLPAGTAGSPIQFEVVGWTGTATTWAQAEANALANTALIGFAGSALSGGALSWVEPTGTSGTPFVMLTGSGAFNELVLAPVPEPSTIAFGGLAAAALLAFRRRK